MTQPNITFKMPDPEKTAAAFCKMLSQILSEKYDAKVTVTKKEKQDEA